MAANSLSYNSQRNSSWEGTGKRRRSTWRSHISVEKRGRESSSAVSERLANLKARFLRKTKPSWNFKKGREGFSILRRSDHKSTWRNSRVIKKKNITTVKKCVSGRRMIVRRFVSREKEGETYPCDGGVGSPRKVRNIWEKTPRTSRATGLRTSATTKN